MTSNHLAIDPQHSATVSASAGTGKTWLLVTRIIRLLLAGARPEGILAITFTRKAAAEMQTRLNDRCLEMARANPAELDALLLQIAAPADPATRHRAQMLYETLLSEAVGIKTTTFHAFCQEILRRFPLEAGIAPGFELLENTAELQQIAWEALCAEASKAPDSSLAQALEVLFDTCGGLANTAAALNSFLEHRSDWWAFTEGQDAPLGFAEKTLSDQLQVTLTDTPEQEFFSTQNLEWLSEFSDLLSRHNTKTNLQYLDLLAEARNPENELAHRFALLTQAFFTQKGRGSPLSRKESKTQAKAMGDDGQQRFLELNAKLCDTIETTRNHLKNQFALRRANAWYQAGTWLLEHFQTLKSELRVLDFADLEWRAYQLLNHSDNVHWIQYKLDQRVDHLLVDEFQDTNPTQWRLILPLLEELAAGENERNRSVFLVGDSKQSIYRFRRADPELFDTAQTWLQEHLHSTTQPLDTSWRSANEIMSFVNRVFSDGPLRQRLPLFIPHTTHHQQLWGKVQLLPLIAASVNSQQTAEEFRNPLTTPRTVEMDQRYLEEGRLIASHIKQLITDKTLLGSQENARTVSYGDIMILTRNRTHIEAYEQALREAGIPYASASRGTLLQSQETKDLVNLLELLITPFNNLALASILRSPLFNCSEQDLIALARIEDSTWIKRLQHLANNPSVTPALHRANELLTRWSQWVGRMPVHDLLDKIFCEGDIINCYQAAYPVHLQHRVTANLTRFIELALEIDSGRYPSIGHFVARLHHMRQQDKEAPDEGIPTQTDSRVRLMTIHASKGLEAPVVFLVDTTNSGSGRKAHQTIVDWPAHAERPTCFLLSSRKDEQDTYTAHILQQHEKAEAREDANLLYVAITRAKQLLFISGCQPNRGKDLGWYGLIMNQCTENTDESHGLSFESGSYPDKPTWQPETGSPTPEIDNRWQQPLFIKPAIAATQSISPSGLMDSSPELIDADSLTRGLVIHRFLQLLSIGDKTELKSRVATELAIPHDMPELESWLKEAESVYSDPQFSWLYPNNSSKAFSELPMQYQLNQKIVFGIIDRLIVQEKDVWVIDYKTHPVTDQQALAEIANTYLQQIIFYCQGARQLWPDHQVHGGLLFTHSQHFIELDI